MDAAEGICPARMIRATAAVLVVCLFLNPIMAMDPEGDPEGEMNLDGIYWPMLGRDVYNTHEGSSGGRGMDDPFIKWEDSDNHTSTGAVCADMRRNVDFQGITERDIVFMVYSNRTHVMIRDGDSGDIAWMADVREIEDRVTSSLFVSPSLMDTDSDDHLEVLVVISDSTSHQLALFEPNITLTGSGFQLSDDSAETDLMWISIFGPQGTTRSSSPVIHDISGDGVEDIIMGAGNRLYAYHGSNGTIMWYLNIGPIGEVLSTPAIYPGTGSIRRIAVNSLLPNRRTMRTTMVNFNGDHLKNVTDELTPPLLAYPYPGTVVPMPVVADLDGGGEPFVIVPIPAISNYGRLKIYSYTLDTETEIDDIVGVYDGFLAVGDLGGESGDEIIIQSRRSGFPNSLVAYEVFWDGAKYDSRRVWTREATGPSPTQYSPPLMCDLDEDGISDAVFPFPGGMTAVLSDGSYHWNISLDDMTTSGSGVIGDLNTDGFVDIFMDGHMISQRSIDLKVKEPHSTNIYLGDTEPVDGSPVTLNCIVENTEGTNVDDVVVRFIDLDGPSSEPVLIGDDRISISNTAEASVEWIPLGDGDHTVTVILDPDDNITETVETNNQGEATFTILSAYSDLNITSIHFLRGDGYMIRGDKHLVEGDPSSIVVTVANIGQKTSGSGSLRVNVNGGAPPGGSEYADFDEVPLDGSINISVPWTPQEIPEGQATEEFLVDAWVSLDSGQREISTDNNQLSNTTVVKNDTPSHALFLQGTVTDPEGMPQEGARVTLEVLRNDQTLGPISTDGEGSYGFEMNLLEYQDGDKVNIRASSDMMWGENSTRVYSEDMEKTVNIDLTDVETLSIFVSPDGDLQSKIEPGEEISVTTDVENDGNVAGDCTVTGWLEGNSSLTLSDVDIQPSTFYLSPGESVEVSLSFTVPGDEPPGIVIRPGLNFTLSDNGSVYRELQYSFQVRGKELVSVEMISQGNVTVSPGSTSTASFEFYIYNRGNIDISYVLSAGASIEDHVQYRKGSGVLFPGDSVSPFVDITLPNGTDSLSGTIMVSTSGQGTVAEYVVSMERSYGNLRVKGVIGSDPESPYLGDEIMLIASVDNGGDISVSDIECSFYEGNTLIGTRTIERDLYPGDSVSVTGVSWTPSGNGAHTVTFRVDPGDRILETDETDNEMERTFNFNPDLSMRSMDIENRQPSAGEEITVSVSVENEGNAPLIRGYMLTLTLGSLSGEQLFSDTYDEELDPRTSPSKTMKFTVNVPEEEGKMSVYASVEPVSDDSELDNSDNSISREIEVNRPDENGGIGSYLPYIIGAVAVLLVAGVGLYIWKFGLPGTPPPDDMEEQADDETPTSEDIKIESVEDTGMDSPGGEGSEDDIPEPPEPGEDDVLDMEITEPPEPGDRSVIVAEVVEDEEEPSGEDESVTEEDEDPLVPEV